MFVYWWGSICILTELLLLFVTSNAWGLNTFEPAGWENISLKIYTVPSQIIPSIDRQLLQSYQMSHSKILHMPRQHCCRGMRKIMLWHYSSFIEYKKMSLGDILSWEIPPFLKRSPDICQWMGSLYLIYKHQALSGPWAKMDTRIWMIHTGRFLTHWGLDKIYF